jgi:hypothetical protein
MKSDNVVNTQTWEVQMRLVPLSQYNSHSKAS